MSREIKFQFFIENENRMIDAVGFVYETDTQIRIWYRNDDNRLLNESFNRCWVKERQCTGMKCISGADIREGDIVTMHQFLFDGNEVESQIFGAIAYNEDRACFELERIINKFYEVHTGYQSGEGKTPICNFYGLHEESWEIIGNIYQNPELLKPVS